MAVELPLPSKKRQRTTDNPNQITKVSQFTDLHLGIVFSQIVRNGYSFAPNKKWGDAIKNEHWSVFKKLQAFQLSKTINKRIDDTLSFKKIIYPASPTFPISTKIEITLIQYFIQIFGDKISITSQEFFQKIYSNFLRLELQSVQSLIKDIIKQSKYILLIRTASAMNRSVKVSQAWDNQIDQDWKEAKIMLLKPTRHLMNHYPMKGNVDMANFVRNVIQQNQNIRINSGGKQYICQVIKNFSQNRYIQRNAALTKITQSMMNDKNKFDDECKKAQSAHNESFNAIYNIDPKPYNEVTNHAQTWNSVMRQIAVLKAAKKKMDLLNKQKQGQEKLFRDKQLKSIVLGEEYTLKKKPISTDNEIRGIGKNLDSGCVCFSTQTSECEKGSGGKIADGLGFFVNPNNVVAKLTNNKIVNFVHKQVLDEENETQKKQLISEFLILKELKDIEGVVDLGIYGNDNDSAVLLWCPGKYCSSPVIPLQALDGYASIGAILDKGGNFTMLQSATIMFQLCSTLGAMYNANRITHNDVSVNNVMTNGTKMKLIDFGKSTRIPIGNNSVRHHDCIGTPSYISGEARVGVACVEGDIYSSGHVGINIAYQERLISDDGATKAEFYKKAHDKFDSTHRDPYAEIVSKMINFRIEDRPHNYDSLVQGFKQVMGELS